MLGDWNATDRPVPDGSVPQLFARAVREAPDATAVVCGADELTYAALDARSAALAGRLLAAGVGPEDRVGILMERSLDSVVAVLAVVRAGAAYLPLDAARPA